MATLDPPEIHHLNAAAGWIELGNLAEAEIELNKIPPALASHPDVLQVKWDWASRRQDWPAALEFARQLIAAVPENCAGWISQSYALHELRRTAEAKEKLLSVVDTFPAVSTVPYNLACYACQLGEHEEAIDWLRKAFAAGGRERIKEIALLDGDLEPLRDRIRKLL